VVLEQAQMSQVIGENNQTFALARISKMLVGF
jgi:hypothetical protein